MISVDVSGRFKVLDQPYSAPSKCAFCSLGHNQNGTVNFIDTTLDFDFYGVVYICSNCLTEIAKSLGYIAPEEYTQLRESYHQVYDENDRLAAENGGLRDAVNILTGHRCASVPVLNSDVLKAEDFTTDEGLASGSLKGVEPAEPKSDKSDSEPGLSDLRGTAKPRPKPTVKPESNGDIFDL